MARRVPLLLIATLLAACAPATDGPDDAPASDGRELLADDHLIYDFGAGADTSWFAVNDTVMGGVSQGEVAYTETGFVFEGPVSTDSNGGFTSVRSPDGDIDLSRFDRAVLHLRSEGQPFSLVLASNPYWYQGQFRYDLQTEDSGWQVVEVPLDAFEFHAFQGGYPTPTGEMMAPEDRERLYYLELMSKLFEDGDFRLEVDYLAFD